MLAGEPKSNLHHKGKKGVNIRMVHPSIARRCSRFSTSLTRGWLLLAVASPTDVSELLKFLLYIFSSTSGHRLIVAQATTFNFSVL
jgi:hypothetical protein